MNYNNAFIIVFFGANKGGGDPNYLCQWHLGGNGNTFFCQKPLLFLSENNFFKLELDEGKMMHQSHSYGPVL